MIRQGGGDSSDTSLKTYHNQSFRSVLSSNIHKRVTLILEGVEKAREGYIRVVGNDYVELERDEGTPRVSYIRLETIYQINIAKSSNLDK